MSGTRTLWESESDTLSGTNIKPILRVVLIQTPFRDIKTNQKDILANSLIPDYD